MKPTKIDLLIDSNIKSSLYLTLVFMTKKINYISHNNIEFILNYENNDMIINKNSLVDTIENIY
jgi:hypothetical protein